MINFMAEISKRSKVFPGFTPSKIWGEAYNIYELFIGKRPNDTYWTRWGGTYDNEETDKIEIYVGEWLDHVAAAQALKEAVKPSLYIEGDIAYINIPKYPWLYKDSQIAMSVREGYIYAPKNSAQPSDLYIDGLFYETRLDIPSISVKLSSPISGMVKYSTFSFSLDNTDGKFDGESSEETFNSPAYIRKTTKDNPQYNDFITIREGVVETIDITDTRMGVTCAEKFRALDEPVCKNINQEGIPKVTITKEGTEGKALPVIFGRCVMPLIEIAETEYIETDVELDNDIDVAGIDKKNDDTITLKGAYLAGEGVRSVVGNVVYAESDSGTVSIPCTFDSENGIIRVNKTDKLYTLTGIDGSGKPVYEKNAKTPKPKYVIVDGYIDNKIGQIVTALAARTGRLAYNGSLWDVGETNQYITGSKPVNIAFTGGDIKKAIADVLKSDMAFLIQKNDGKFTLRRWDGLNGNHTIESWYLTQQPQKRFSEAQRNYFSSCIIKYGYNQYAKTHNNQYVYTDREDEAEGRYLKKLEKEFETHLTSKTDAVDLAGRLGRRFCELKDTVSMGVGADTSSFNLLDTVNMEISVNGRKYSNNTQWIIVEIDPAQDKLVLEEA